MGKIIGVDLGGSNVQTARLFKGEIEAYSKLDISAGAAAETVLQEVRLAIDAVMDNRVSAIGIGVPGLVDLPSGTVYELVNIPSWEKVHLKSILEKKYELPVYVNNDANCFALGEKYYGHGKNYKHLVGLILGTGMGAGIILDNKLYGGSNCGAGEFGMLPYLDQNYEYYGSGQFFKKRFNINGAALYEKAQSGDKQALKIFAEFGKHVGQALKVVFYTLDPEIIVLGGSVSKAFPFFKETMWQSFSRVAYHHAFKNIKVEVSADTRIPLLGAAALVYENQLKSTRQKNDEEKIVV